MVTRQAVVLIHGIGDQKPMETLRAFVDTVWRHHTDIHHRFAGQQGDTLTWSKPDTVSDSFELRRLTTPKNLNDIRTDFFEFYWQHLMEGTTYGHVIGWMSTLLLRRPRTVPAQLRAPYWLLWVLTVFAVALALNAAASAAMGTPSASPWLSAIASVALVPLAGVVIKGTIGDAARYLHPAPANVQCRHAIREAGIKVLVALHDRGYDRIIIAGHSLGSVIGYDILTHAWPRYNVFMPAPTPPLTAHLEALESLASDGPADVGHVHRAQRLYFDELTANGCRWRVTDFLTLGSPLAHASVLLAKDGDDLKAKQCDRELPTSLPTLERTSEHNKRVARFSFPAEARKGFRTPHHAAVFGPTRWTNLYFPNRLLVYGDLIGGPLRDAFGEGICDLAVTTRQRRGLLSHTLYWKYDTAAAAPEHIQTLRAALDLLDDGRGPLPPVTKTTPSMVPASEVNR